MCVLDPHLKYIIFIYVVFWVEGVNSLAAPTFTAHVIIFGAKTAWQYLVIVSCVSS